MLTSGLQVRRGLDKTFNPPGVIMGFQPLKTFLNFTGAIRPKSERDETLGRNVYLLDIMNET